MMRYCNLYPDNYYSGMPDLEKGLRKSTSLCESLIPIPASDLHSHILRKHQNNNQIYVEELEVKTQLYFKFKILNFYVM